jgi:hypothetical protein
MSIIDNKAVVGKQFPVSSVWNYDWEPNQVYPELSNVLSMNWLEGGISSSRKQMFSSHLSQCLVIHGATPKRIQSGAEIKYGRATFNKKIRNDAKILHILPYYQLNRQGMDVIKSNPETLIIFEDMVTGEIDCLSMTEYCSNHTHFGYRYKNTPAAKDLYPGKLIAGNTVLQDSPSVGVDGNYKYGVELNVAMATLPGGAEDGIIVSEEALPWLKAYAYDRRRIEWGSSNYPRNLYGDENNYKPFPDIGEYVRPDGLLMALCTYDECFNPIDMHTNALRKPSYTFDKLVHVEPGAKVIDIRVHHDISRPSLAGAICNAQALRYDTASREFYKALLKIYNGLEYNMGSRLNVSHRLKNYIKTAYSLAAEETPPGQKRPVVRIQKHYKGAARDDITVEFVLQYETVPTVGNKATDITGGKGVFVKVLPKEDMPVDDQGNRAHLVVDPGATISRMNITRLYEQFYNACSRDLTKEFCAFFGVAWPDVRGQKLDIADKVRIKRMFANTFAGVSDVWARFLRYIEIVSPRLHPYYSTVVSSTHEKMAEHMISILEDGIYVYIPPDNEAEPTHVLRKLKAEFMPFIGQLTYRGNSGKIRRTKESILIGSMYIMVLEKTGSDWSAVSSGKLQNFGVLSQISNQDKHSSPIRLQAIRAWGETETAIGVSYMGPYVMAEIKDRNNNILSHRFAVMNLLQAKTPTNVPVLVDRSKIPLGNDRSLVLVEHFAFCAGWEFTYNPYKEMHMKFEPLPF